MYSKNMKVVFFLAAIGVFASSKVVLATDADIASVDASVLPINVSAQSKDAEKSSKVNETVPNGLVSPSQAQQVSTNKVASQPAIEKQVNQEGTAPVQNAPQAVATAQPSANNDFNFDLKVQAAGSQSVPVVPTETRAANTTTEAVDLPENIQYTVDPVENLGNGVLSQMDSDLFTQMSEIEKSTTLLTLELRREKLRNEIEAQKAIRRKNADDFEKQQEDSKLKALERKKQIEAKILQEQQLVLDKEKVIELLKQRKLLTAYMNQMLIQQQAWLTEKENLYAQLAAAEKEKQELVAMFKQRIDKVLEASAKNIQTAEAAKANFERIVKGLKSRNEQLRKRIEADAKIIKSAKSNLFIKSESIEELKDKKAQAAALDKANATDDKTVSAVTDNEKADEVILKKLSSEYAILGITGRAGALSVDLIDSTGQSLSLKNGSILPTGHVVSEIGSDYVRFTCDGFDDFLYVGKTIDGIIPTLETMTVKSK